MTRSQFVYDRSLQRDLAAVLADVRAQCWCDPQLMILDQTVDALVEQFSIDPAFDADDFDRRTRAHQGTSHPYQPRRPSCPTTTSPSSAT